MAKGGRPENLRPVKTTDEARARGSAGGKKSAAVKRRKKELREATAFLMSLPTSYEDVKEEMRLLGIVDDEMTNQMAILVSMFKRAVQGDVKAAVFIKEALGDDQAEQERKRKYELELKKSELEIKKLEKQIEMGDNPDEGMPIIINVRPNE